MADVQRGGWIVSALRNGFIALGRWLGDSVGARRAAPAAPAPGGAASPSASEIEQRVTDTSQMPPFPGPLETLGVDRLPYAQLHADLWTLRQAEDSWSRLATSTRNRLWRVYPEYLAAATRQRIMEAAAAAGIHDVTLAFGYWIRRWGDPMLEARVRLEWFLRVIEAQP